MTYELKQGNESLIYYNHIYNKKIRTTYLSIKFDYKQIAEIMYEIITGKKVDLWGLSCVDRQVLYNKYNQIKQQYLYLQGKQC